MADETLFIKKSSLTKIGDAVRTKGGTSEPLSVPDGIVSAVEAIPAGGGGGGYPQDNPAMTHNLPRGKFLGTSVTEKQYADIANGTFEDMYVGDYWTIDGVDWIVAGVNYCKNQGLQSMDKNHLAIIPRTSLYNAKMNLTNTTDHGYLNSNMHTQGLDQAITIINKAFPGHVLKKQLLLTSTMAEGQGNADWTDSTVDLMTEQMVFGCTILKNVSNQGIVPYKKRPGDAQLPVFAFAPELAKIREPYWLQDICSDTLFSAIFNFGNVVAYNPTQLFGVRPWFIIG